MTAKKNTINQPPKVLARNDYGLLEDKDISYKYKENGLVDWRSMIDPSWLYPNPSSVASGKANYNTDVSTLQDKDLCIKLFGLKELALIRGYTNVSYNVVKAAQDYVAVSCGITWVPNYESENKEIYFEAIADAHWNNTKNFAKNFLSSIAENRAFGRCVRGFLGINVVGDFELGEIEKKSGVIGFQQTKPDDLNPTDPRATLLRLMTEKNVTLPALKAKIAKEKMFDGAESVESLEEIPDKEVFKLIERLNKLKAKKR